MPVAGRQGANVEPEPAGHGRAHGVQGPTLALDGAGGDDLLRCAPAAWRSRCASPSSAMRPPACPARMHLGPVARPAQQHQSGGAANPATARCNGVCGWGGERACGDYALIHRFMCGEYCRRAAARPWRDCYFGQLFAHIPRGLVANLAPKPAVDIAPTAAAPRRPATSRRRLNGSQVGFTNRPPRRTLLAAQPTTNSHAAFQPQRRPARCTDPRRPSVVGLAPGAGRPGGAAPGGCAGRYRPGAWRTEKKHSRLLRSLRAFLVARSRFAEPAGAVARPRRSPVRGARGRAGYLCLPRPHAAAGLRVWEVDHPATQAYKREQLAAAGIAVPDSTAYVPIDFRASLWLRNCSAMVSMRSSPASFPGWGQRVPGACHRARHAALGGHRHTTGLRYRHGLHAAHGPAALANARGAGRAGWRGRSRRALAGFFDPLCWRSLCAPWVPP